jgi:glycosyltransferase involved in cell wall biosynthesis
MSEHTPGSYDLISETPKLSVVVIAKNEADRIGRLLASVKDAYEVIVVDSGSSDGTPEVCEHLGAKFVHMEWLGYARQKQAAMDLASGDWILNLDADEALSPELAMEIPRAMEAADPSITGFSMPRLSRYLNKWIRHGGWYPDRKIRLVRKGCGKWVGDALHERLEVAGSTLELKNPILHYVYRDICDQVETINRFSRVFAANRTGNASGLYVLAGIFHAFGKFLECAIWKRGLLDGVPGVIIAMNSSFYVFLKHAKAWELNQRPQADQQLMDSGRKRTDHD